MVAVALGMTRRTMGASGVWGSGPARSLARSAHLLELEEIDSSPLFSSPLLSTTPCRSCPSRHLRVTPDGRTEGEADGLVGHNGKEERVFRFLELWGSAAERRAVLSWGGRGRAGERARAPD